MKYYSAIKKEWNFVICNNMEWLGGYYAKWNNKSKKIKQTSEYNKKETDAQI